MYSCSTPICDEFIAPVTLWHLWINPLTSSPRSINTVQTHSLFQISTMTHRSLVSQDSKINNHTQKQFIENIRSRCCSYDNENSIKLSVLHPQCSKSWTMWNVDRSHQIEILTKKFLVAPEHVQTKEMRQFRHTLTKQKQTIIKFYPLIKILKTKQQSAYL